MILRSRRQPARSETLKQVCPEGPWSVSQRLVLEVHATRRPPDILLKSRPCKFFFAAAKYGMVEGSTKIGIRNDALSQEQFSLA